MIHSRGALHITAESAKWKGREGEAPRTGLLRRVAQFPYFHLFVPDPGGDDRVERSEVIARQVGLEGGGAVVELVEKDAILALRVEAIVEAPAASARRMRDCLVVRSSHGGQIGGEHEIAEHARRRRQGAPADVDEADAPDHDRILERMDGEARAA